MSDSVRIEQLRRRVRSDPASIAFAALAEEYRRDGRYLEAIEICRVGLQRHPAYLSARVTLGRALIGIGDLEAARLELEAVLRVAPENLSAIRAMADIYSQLRDPEVLPQDEPEEHPIALATDAPSPAQPNPEPNLQQAAIMRLEHFLEAIVDARARMPNPDADVRRSADQGGG